MIIIISIKKLSLEVACISVYRNLVSCEPILSLGFMWITKLPKLKAFTTWVAAAETSLVVAVATSWQSLRYFPASSVL